MGCSMSARGEPPAADGRRKYVDASAIFDALEGDATLLLRASWLKTQSGEHCRLIKRGDKLPPEATITAAELRSIWERRTLHKGKKQALPLLTLSHFWRTKNTPDPDGETLHLVAKTLQWRWREFTKHGVTDLGVFIDYCSLYQPPRTAAQEAAFARALRAINLWYAHQGTTVWLVTGGHDDANLRYWDKGWCQFEYALTMMIKIANTSAWAEWPQVVDLGQVGREEQINVARPPPAPPLAFFGGHEYGDKLYRDAADRDALVAPIFRDTVTELLAHVDTLNYNKLGWSDVELAKLAEVLPLCKELTVLHLTGNARIGDDGVRALAHACAQQGAGKVLIELRLGGNSIGDDGLSALVDAATTHGALATLKELHLNINRIGDVGVSTLADALTAGPAGVWEQLHTLNLQHNAIGQPGVEALSAALARGGLPSLRHLQWPATHLADASLVASCQGRSIQLG